MKSRLTSLLALILTITSTLAESSGTAPPPGIVIHHSPASSGLYIGSPALCVLPGGAYLASHDYFGPRSQEHVLARGAVFRSDDRGLTWRPVAEVDGWFWSNLFLHHSQLYSIGMDKHHGQLICRRSNDEGKTWTRSVIAPGEWHTAPMPVVEHGGRIWRAVEDAMGGTKWGARYRARVISAPADADLLKPESWTLSEPLARDPAWLGGTFDGWLEGNAVIDPAGGVLDILRVDLPGLPEKAALVCASADGRSLAFDPAAGFIDFPGGAKKFVIRKDPAGDGYWALANIVTDAFPPHTKPAAIRNTLALVHSMDLRTWETRCILLHHPDLAKHGFQYPDWLFDGADLITTVRTAWDDAEGGAHNNHDANFLTFHRWKNFRALTRKDDAR